MKKTLFIFITLVCGYLTPAQDILTQAAEEACACLKGLDPDAITEKQMSFRILGCLVKHSDEVEAELKKQKKFKGEPLEAVTAIRNASYERCAEEFERLNKERPKVEVDPALLKLNYSGNLPEELAQKICQCLEITKEKDWNECFKRVINANEETIEKPLTAGYKDKAGDNMLKAMMCLGVDLGFALTDHCELLDDENFRNMRKFPAVTSGCSDLIRGEYLFDTVIGKVKAVVTADRYTEYVNGKLTEDYDLSWNGCTAKLVSRKAADFVKKGEVMTMEVKRASSEGYISVIYYRIGPSPHHFVKIK